MFDYSALAVHCRTQNQFNRLHIELENLLAPAELASIARYEATPEFANPSPAWRDRVKVLAPNVLGEPERFTRGNLPDWLDKIRKWAPRLFDAPQHYRRQALSDQVTLYQDPEGAPRDKSLLVAFTGDGRRLMMPIPVFLQYLDCRLWDVVLLKKCARNSYLRGLTGVTDNFPGVVGHIEALAQPKQYRRVMTIGTCSGAYSAIWGAVLMGADRGVSVCGGTPRLSASEVRRKRRKVYQPGPEPHGVDLRFVYGMDCTKDHKEALALVETFGGKLCPVHGIGGHGVFGLLLKRGEFADFIDEVLA